MVGLIGQRQPGGHPQRPDLDLVLEFCYRALDFGQPDLVIQQRTPLLQKLGAPLFAFGFGALLRGPLGTDVPFVRPGGDDFLVCDHQLQCRVGQGLLGGLDQCAVDRRLGQPDLGVVLVTELPIRHAPYIGQIGCDHRKFVGIDRGSRHVGTVTPRLGGIRLAGVHLDPVGPIQRDPRLAQMGRGMRRQGAGCRRDCRHDDGLRRQDSRRNRYHVGPSLRDEQQVGFDVLLPLVVFPGVQ